MTRAPLSAPAERPTSAERRLVAVLLVLTCALRGAYLAHYRVDSDEPQHLHVAWAWANGLLQYRDVFDNHAPLFHLACAPIVRLVGERPDAVALMRAVMLLPYAVVVVATGVVAARLFSPRVAWWSLPVAALAPAYFLTSIEFRSDDAWAALFVCALAVLVGGAAPARRAFRAGVLLGTALAVSMKTSLLVVAVVFAGATVVAMSRARGDARAWRASAGAALAGLAGLTIVPAGVAAGFLAAGAIGPMLYGTVWHNVLPGLGLWHRAPERVLVIPLATPVLLVAARWVLGHAPSSAIGARRAFVLLVAGGYLVLLGGVWPLLTAEDWLPVAPLLPLACAAAAAAVLERRDEPFAVARRVSPRVALLAVVAVEVAIAVRSASPLADRALPERNLLASVLRLTHPGEFVMDVKGESVFRPRPYFYALEYITKERVRRGLIRDDVPERLIVTRTAVVAADSSSFPRRGRVFMQDHYVSVGDVRVLGRWIVRPGDRVPRGPVAFDVAIPERYVVVALDGEARGSLDGRRYQGARDLTAGLHEFRPDPDSGPLALVWARAIEQGFVPILAEAAPG
jgi:hypothetical protein